MNKLPFINLSIWILATLFSCDSTPQNQSKESQNQVQNAKNEYTNQVMQVPYRILDRYFVNSTFQDKGLVRFDSEAQFESAFSPASVMGPNGVPEKIDFKTEFAFSIIMPETNKATQIIPISLNRTQDGKLLFTYKIQTGNSQSFTIKPHLTVIVENQYEGEVITRREE